MGSKVTKKKNNSPELCTRPPTSIFRGPVNGRTHDYEYKLILVGDSCTGKTSLKIRFAGGDRSAVSKVYVTIGVDITFHTIVLDGSRIKLLVYDFSGKEKYRQSYPIYFRYVHGVIIVYDATVEETYDNVPYWLEEVKKHAPPEATVMLVGNRCDLTEKKVVDYRTAKDFAGERGIVLMETSAMDGTNVELAFLTLVAKIKEADPT